MYTLPRSTSFSTADLQKTVLSLNAKVAELTKGVGNQKSLSAKVAELTEELGKQKLVSVELVATQVSSFSFHFFLFSLITIELKSNMLIFY